MWTSSRFTLLGSISFFFKKVLLYRCKTRFRKKRMGSFSTREHATRFVCLRYENGCVRKLFSLSTTVLLYNLHKYRWFIECDSYEDPTAVCDATHAHKVFWGGFTLLELKKSGSVFSRCVIIVLGENKVTTFLFIVKKYHFHITQC